MNIKLLTLPFLLLCFTVSAQVQDSAQTETIRIRKDQAPCRAMIGGLMNGEIKWKDLDRTGGIRFSCPDCILVSYVITIALGNNLCKSICCQGFPDPSVFLSRLRLKPGQWVCFDNIKYLAVDGTIKKTNTIQLRIIP
ncbi:MAG: hypothetical protein ACHQRM_17320 [Bacteroidia bacterium]